MKIFKIRNMPEKGQVIPLVIVMFFVIIGMVALIIDGGAIMFNRRTAQAAADAGALAGAQRACLGKNDAKSVAENYAIAKNGATTALATVVGMQVTVNATVEYPSFFAGIFGEPTLKASAEATAGCFGVKGKAVLPIAWHCEPNDGGPFNDEYGCKMQTLSWQLIRPLVDPTWNPQATTISIPDYDGNLVTYHKSGTSIVDAVGVPPEQIYIVLDSEKLCIKDGIGDIQCDLDGDGKNDILAKGDRGYLYLTADTSSISKWITDSPDFIVKSHVWLSGKSGGQVDVEIKMVDTGFPGRVALVPVYNYLCNNNPQTDSTCVDGAHASPPWPAFDGMDDFSEISNQSPYFHIVAFAPFYISCVSKSGDCPGYLYARTINSTLAANEPIIEGYFLSDVDVSPDSTQDCLINLGSCSISLSK